MLQIRKIQNVFFLLRLPKPFHEVQGQIRQHPHCAPALIKLPEHGFTVFKKVLLLKLFHGIFHLPAYLLYLLLLLRRDILTPDRRQPGKCSKSRKSLRRRLINLPRGSILPFLCAA